MIVCIKHDTMQYFPKQHIETYSKCALAKSMGVLPSQIENEAMENVEMLFLLHRAEAETIEYEKNKAKAQNAVNSRRR